MRCRGPRYRAEGKYRQEKVPQPPRRSIAEPNRLEVPTTRFAQQWDCTTLTRYGHKRPPDVRRQPVSRSRFGFVLKDNVLASPHTTMCGTLWFSAVRLPKTICKRDRRNWLKTNDRGFMRFRFLWEAVGFFDTSVYECQNPGGIHVSREALQVAFPFDLCEAAIGAIPTPTARSKVSTVRRAVRNR
jgi:hypothetical protein